MSALEWIAAVFVVAGLLMLAVSVYGLLRLRDTYMRLHAATKAVSIGAALIAMGSIGSGDVWIVARALLVALFLIVTVPASSHAIAKSAYLRREPMASPNSEDESGRLNDVGPGERSGR